MLIRDVIFLGVAVEKRQTEFFINSIDCSFLKEISPHSNGSMWIIMFGVIPSYSKYERVDETARIINFLWFFLSHCIFFSKDGPIAKSKKGVLLSSVF